jgi:peptide/nickel transport system substrate-binding protein
VLFAQVVHDDPDPYLTWHSSQAGPRGANVASLHDERIDETLETAREADTDELRSELYAKFQALFAQEVPALPLYTSTALYVQRKAVRGAHPGYLDNPGSRFWQVHEWYVRTR